MRILTYKTFHPSQIRNDTVNIFQSKDGELWVLYDELFGYDLHTEISIIQKPTIDTDKEYDDWYTDQPCDIWFSEDEITAPNRETFLPYVQAYTSIELTSDTKETHYGYNICNRVLESEDESVCEFFGILVPNCLRMETRGEEPVDAAYITDLVNVDDYEWVLEEDDIEAFNECFPELSLPLLSQDTGRALLCHLTCKRLALYEDGEPMICYDSGHFMCC